MQSSQIVEAVIPPGVSGPLRKGPEGPEKKQGPSCQKCLSGAIDVSERWVCVDQEIQARFNSVSGEWVSARCRRWQKDREGFNYRRESRNASTRGRENKEGSEKTNM